MRVEREERTFDREEVLGRDTASVFPSLEGGGGAGEGGASEEAKKMASSLSPRASSRPSARAAATDRIPLEATIRRLQARVSNTRRAKRDEGTGV